MSFIRVTKINSGAKGTSRYNPKELSIDFARKCGLLKYSLWLYEIKEGDTLIVPFKNIEAIREAGKGVFEFQIEHPKYANQTLYSDTNPYEVVEWKSETRVLLRRLDTSGYCGEMGEHCETYTSNPNNIVFEVREHKNGGLYEPNTKSCPYILSEEPYYYRDPCF